MVRLLLGYVAVFREFAAVAFLIALCTFLYWKEPDFLSRGNVLDILVQVSAVAIAAAGMTFVILTAGIDLSVGSILALAGCTGALAANEIAGEGAVAVPIGVGIVLVVGAFCGLLNGLLITKLHLTPFIATLGLMSIARGLAYVLSENSPVLIPDDMRVFARFRVLEIPIPILLLFATYLFCWVLLRFTLFGRYLYAIGGNELATKLSGVRVGVCKTLAYVLSGLLAGLSALILAGRLGWMDPQQGEGFELDVIAAVVIGGTSLYGGEGSIWGTFLGALIMGVVRNGLNFMGVDYNLQKIVIGCIILVAVTVDVFARKVSLES